MRSKSVRYAGTVGKSIDIDLLVGAVNSMRDVAARAAVVDALKIHFPDVIWTTSGSPDWRLYAQVHAGY